MALEIKNLPADMTDEAVKTALQALVAVGGFTIENASYNKLKQTARVALKPPAVAPMAAGLLTKKLVGSQTISAAIAPLDTMLFIGNLGALFPSSNKRFRNRVSSVLSFSLSRSRGHALSLSPPLWYHPATHARCRLTPLQVKIFFNLFNIYTRIPPSRPRTSLEHSITGSKYDDSALLALCEGFGSITRAFILRDQITANSKGYGFVDFLTNAQADKVSRVIYIYIHVCM